MEFILDRYDWFEIERGNSAGRRKVWDGLLEVGLSVFFCRDTVYY